MKKALIIVAAIVVAFALLISFLLSFRAEDDVATSAARPWPGGMGVLDSAAGRWPALKANDASVKLAALANALPQNDAISAFVEREMQRGEVTIGDPPAMADVSAIRELLLKEPVVWKSEVGIGGGDESTGRRAMQMNLGRTLVASALVKARTNDPAAWEDLHAAWNLARSVDGHPQMMAQTAALSIARMINAVAWKMPLPAPAWFAELQQRDNVQPLLAAFHYLAASYTADGMQLFPTKFLAKSVEHDRLIAQELFTTTQCDVNMRMNDLGTDLSFIWRRAFRYRAEREATANALRVREGKPIETASRCSDGAWTYDGTTLRFSREIPTGPPDAPMPLVLKVRSQRRDDTPRAPVN